jgi:hypothetical protein
MVFHQYNFNCDTFFDRGIFSSGKSQENADPGAKKLESPVYLFVVCTLYSVSK